MFLEDEDPNLTEENQDVVEPEGEQEAEESSAEEQATEAQKEEEKAFAEKHGVPFHDEANLVKGYKELQAMVTRTAQENAEMRGILKTLAERQGTPQNAAAEEPDIETYYADEPAILPLAKEVKQLRQALGNQELQVGRQAALEVVKFTDEFFAENPVLKNNPAVLKEFLDDLNDRLPGFRFQDFYDGALKGETLNPTYAPEIKKKLRLALKATVGAATSKADEKKKVAEDKVKKMSDTIPPKSTEEKPKAADLKKMTNREIREYIKRNYV